MRLAWPEHGGSIKDGTGLLGLPQIFRQRANCLEIPIPPHRLLARPHDGSQVGQLDVAQLGHTDPQVDQAIGRIGISGIERGQQPDGVCIRGEQPHDGQRVDGLAVGTGLAVGQQLPALVLGDESVHRRPLIEQIR